MDEKNPRVAAERVRGSADKDLTALDRTTSAIATPDSSDAGPESHYRPAPMDGAATSRATGTEYSSRSATDEPSDRRTREIRAEIEQTREDMSETVDAIQERLRPSTLASNAAETVKHAARSTAREIADSESITYITANPIPTAMVGIGIAGLVWLATAGRDARSVRSSRPGRRYSGDDGDWESERRYGRDPFRNSDWRQETSAGAAFDPAYGRQSSRYDSDDWNRSETSDWSDVRGQATRRAAQTYRTGQNYVQRTWSESPLLVGAASAVLGAIIGLGIPETERENELMGETRDNMIESVQETVREKVDQVQQAATNAVSSVQEAAKSVVGLTQSPESSPTNRPKSERPS